MSHFKEVSDLRQKGKLKEAYEKAFAEWKETPDDIWAKRALGWVYYDLLKNATERNLPGKLVEITSLIQKINLPQDENIFYESIAWMLAKFLNNAKVVDTKTLTGLFKNIKDYPFPKTSDSYPFLLKSFIKHSENWENIFEFIEWWGLDNFRDKDYKDVVLSNGKNMMSDVERVYIAVSKHLLKEPVDIEKIEKFLPHISHLCSSYPSMQYPHYYYAKLLLASGKKDKFLEAFIPFARKKKRDFWVWDLMSEVFPENDERYFSCLCRSLACGAPVKFSLNVKEKFAEILLKKGLLKEAKHEIEEIVKCRTDNGWKISGRLQKMLNDERLAKVKAVKSNVNLYNKYASKADEVLYYNLPEDIIVIEHVNKEKKVAYFVASKEKYGSFLYAKHKIDLEPGDILSVRFLEGNHDKSPNFYKVATISKTDSPPPPEILKTVKGTLKINPGSTFGFVNNVFVSPDILKANKALKDQIIEVTAVMSYNKKKKEWGWKAIKLVNKN